MTHKHTVAIKAKRRGRSKEKREKREAKSFFVLGLMIEEKRTWSFVSSKKMFDR